MKVKDWTHTDAKLPWAMKNLIHALRRLEKKVSRRRMLKPFMTMAVWKLLVADLQTKRKFVSVVNASATPWQIQMFCVYIRTKMCTRSDVYPFYKIGLVPREFVCQRMCSAIEKNVRGMPRCAYLWMCICEDAYLWRCVSVSHTFYRSASVYLLMMCSICGKWQMTGWVPFWMCNFVAVHFVDEFVQKCVEGMRRAMATSIYYARNLL